MEFRSGAYLHKEISTELILQSNLSGSWPVWGSCRRIFVKWELLRVTHLYERDCHGIYKKSSQERKLHWTWAPSLSIDKVNGLPRDFWKKSVREEVAGMKLWRLQDRISRQGLITVVWKNLLTQSTLVYGIYYIQPYIHPHSS